MKNTFNKLFERIASIMFALTLVFDYFPEIGISYKVSALVMILFIVLAVITQDHLHYCDVKRLFYYSSETTKNKKRKFQI